jgi:hypothetical protein
MKTWEENLGRKLGKKKRSIVNSASSLPLLVLSLVSIVAHGHTLFPTGLCGRALLLWLMAKLELIFFSLCCLQVCCNGNGDVGFHDGTMMIFIHDGMFLMLLFFFIVVLLLVVTLYSSTAPCGQVILLLVVALCYSLWLHIIVPCDPTPCGQTLLLLVVAFYYSLWSHFATCGRVLLLLMVAFCYLWSCSATICGHVLLLLMVMFHSSLFVSPPCGCVLSFLVVASRVLLL